MSEINLLSILLGAMLVGCGSDPSTTVQMSDAGCNQPPDTASDETGADVVVQEEASDLDISVGHAPNIRITGQLVPLSQEKIIPDIS